MKKWIFFSFFFFSVSDYLCFIFSLPNDGSRFLPTSGQALPHGPEAPRRRHDDRKAAGVHEFPLPTTPAQIFNRRHPFWKHRHHQQQWSQQQPRQSAYFCHSFAGCCQSKSHERGWTLSSSEATCVREADSSGLPPQSTVSIEVRRNLFDSRVPGSSLGSRIWSSPHCPSPARGCGLPSSSGHVVSKLFRHLCSVCSQQLRNVVGKASVFHVVRYVKVSFTD